MITLHSCMSPGSRWMKAVLEDSQGSSEVFFHGRGKRKGEGSRSRPGSEGQEEHMGWGMLCFGLGHVGLDLLGLSTL